MTINKKRTWGKLKNYINSSSITAISLLMFVLFFNSKCETGDGPKSGETERGSFIDLIRGSANCDETIQASSSQYFVYINSLGVGCVLASINIPEETRYEEASPIVLVTPTFFTPSSYKPNLETGSPDVNKLGAIEVHPILPSRCIDVYTDDGEKSLCSEGDKDQGGEQSQKAMRAVLRYLLGIKKDGSNQLITDLVPSADTNNVGVFAFSHPGMLAMTTLSNWGAYFPEVSYVVMRENPTMDLFASVELGDVAVHTICNPAYRYSVDYNSDYISLDYSTVKWYEDGDDSRPYFDLNENDEYDTLGAKPDFLLGTRIPGIDPSILNPEEEDTSASSFASSSDKNLYSTELLQALEENLPPSLFPKNLLTAEEAANYWNGRVTLGKDFDGNDYNAYDGIATNFPELRQMIVFSNSQHVQVCPDAPTVHQAYDGFKSRDLWVRINPDKKYVYHAYVVTGKKELYDRTYFPDNEANTPAASWENATEELAYSDKAPKHGEMVSIAALAEMMDRTHYNKWSSEFDNLEAVITEE